MEKLILNSTNSATFDEKWSRKNIFEIPPCAKVDFCTKLQMH